MGEQVEILQGDCLEVMTHIPDVSIDLILCDLPYGTTNCRWDIVIPFEPLWAHYKRVIKPRGVIVLTAKQPFTSALVMSNPGWFRFQDIWDKRLPTGHLNARKMPLRRHEDICVFSPATLGNFTYNPQMRRGVYRQKGAEGRKSECYGAHNLKVVWNDTYYPTSIVEVSNARQVEKTHPTQKPVALFEYLIRTYTNPGELVLDNAAGSGTTGIAALSTGRRAILIEREPKYVEIIKQRLGIAQKEAA